MLQVILILLYIILTAVFCLAVWRLRYARTHFVMKTMTTSATMIEDMPSVTVCIPTRNEHHVLNDSLQHVIASTYPKLEIIVLDDKSQDDTPVLIKAFAQDGVRFVEGEKLPAGWQGKNHALQGLVKEASGTYIFFMDIDTRLSPDSIEQLVAYAQSEQALMVSVLPRREDGVRGSVVFSPLRHFWEIMFHSKTKPASASNAWLVHRQTLLDRFGGFGAIKDVIQPESRVAAALMPSGQYRFLIGTKQLGISYEKKWRSQLSTSVRLMYPLLGMKPANAFIAATDLLIVSMPVWIILSGLIIGWSFNHGITAIFFLMFAGLYGIYLKKVWNKGWIIGGLLWGLIAVQEAVLIIISAIRYIQKTVTWKGRLVTSPK